MKFDAAIDAATTETVHRKGMPIEFLDLPYKTNIILKRAEIYTIGQLRSMTDDDLMKVRNLGYKAIKEIKEALKRV